MSKQRGRRLYITLTPIDLHLIKANALLERTTMAGLCRRWIEQHIYASIEHDPVVAEEYVKLQDQMRKEAREDGGLRLV